LTITKAALWVVGLLVAIQLVPFGREHTNPPVTGEPKWDSPTTRALVQRACFDCHSNETTWPWYSHVAPVSWLVQRDVNGGRRHINFTEWNTPPKHTEDIRHEVEGGDMPPWFYLPMHPNAKLTAADQQALIDGATKTFGPQK
jgi:hypothetical protein